MTNVHAQGLRGVSGTDAGRVGATGDVDGLDPSEGRSRSDQTSNCGRERGTTEEVPGLGGGTASRGRRRTRTGR